MTMTYTKDLSMMQILMVSSLHFFKVDVDYEIKILDNFPVWGSLKVN